MRIEALALSEEEAAKVRRVLEELSLL
jgi:hypothetical protein